MEGSQEDKCVEECLKIRRAVVVQSLLVRLIHALVVSKSEKCVCHDAMDRVSAVTIALYTDKSDKHECNNFRSRSVLSVVGQMYRLKDQRGQTRSDLGCN